MGYVELLGTAHDAAWPPLRSQIRKTPCVWYRYQIERRVGATWITESSRASTQCFVLRDSTGDCIVDPEGAEVLPRQRRVWREFEYRYHEAVIALGESVYVLGELTSVHAALDTPAEERADISALLAEWKREPEELMRRFDANRDGTLSDEEWEVARREAKATHRARVHRAPRARPGESDSPPGRRPQVHHLGLPARAARAPVRPVGVAAPGSAGRRSRGGAGGSGGGGSELSELRRGRGSRTW